MSARPSDGTTVLEARELRVSFPSPAGPRKAVDGVSFTLRAGRTLGLVGESGCGKTLTGLSLLRLVPPPGELRAERLRLEGTELLGLPERAVDRLRGNRIGMIFQNPGAALNPIFSVGRQIAEVYRVHRERSRAQAWKEAVEMLRRVGVPDPAARARSYPHELSGGMRQRAMIAMALACEPRVLVADEPTTALDVTVQAQVLDLLLAKQRELGTAMLFISHDLAVISEVSDDVAVMYGGRLVEDGPAEALLRNPRHPYTRALLASLPETGALGEDRPSGASPEGEPEEGAPAQGCRYLRRCGEALPECRSGEPPPASCSPAHSAACFRC